MAVHSFVQRTSQRNIKAVPNSYSTNVPNVLRMERLWQIRKNPPLHAEGEEEYYESYGYWFCCLYFSLSASP